MDEVIGRALQMTWRDDFRSIVVMYFYCNRMEMLLIIPMSEWCADGINSNIAKLQKVVLEEEIPWICEKNEKIGRNPCSSLVTSTQKKQKKKKLLFEELEVTSFIFVPMVSSGKFRGFLGFDCVEKTIDWSHEIVSLLRIIGEIFTHLLERKRAEHELRSALRRNKTILAAVPDIILEINEKKILSWANPAGLEFFGADAIGEPIEKFLIRDSENDFSLDEKKEKIEYVENWVYNKSGNERLLALWGRAIQDHENKKSGMLLTARDITEQNRIEKERQSLETKLYQQQKLESIGTLAGGVAHEINNPINGIMNYAQLILDKLKKNQPVEEYAEEIISESERIATIVRNLLAFARQEQQRASFSTVDEIVEKTLSLIRTVIRHDQITLDVNISPNLPMIECRNQQIQQVLMNLMINARDSLNEKYKGYHKEKIIKIQVKKMKKNEEDWIHILPRRQRYGNYRGSTRAHVQSILHNQRQGQRNGSWIIHQPWNHKRSSRRY